MNTSSKTVLAIIVLAVLIVGGVWLSKKAEAPSPAANENGTSEVADQSATAAPAAPVTDKIADILPAFTQEQTEEAALSSQNDEDTKVVTSDDQAINDFNQIYNQDELQ